MKTELELRGVWSRSQQQVQPSTSAHQFFSHKAYCSPSSLHFRISISALPEEVRFLTFAPLPLCPTFALFFLPLLMEILAGSMGKKGECGKLLSFDLVSSLSRTPLLVRKTLCSDLDVGISAPNQRCGYRNVTALDYFKPKITCILNSIRENINHTHSTSWRTTFFDNHKQYPSRNGHKQILRHEQNTSSPDVSRFRVIGGDSVKYSDVVSQ